MTTPPSNTIATLTICYESSSGVLTQRGVSVTEFDDHEMVGFCHLRNRYRTFLYERVTSCVNVQTGEVVNDIYSHIRDAYRESPIYVVDRLYREQYEALQILVYVSKADGRLMAPERKVLRAACRVLANNPAISDELADQLIKDVKVHSERAFKVAVGRVAKQGNANTMRRLMIACQTMVNTQRSVTLAEQEALDYLAKRFASGK